MTLTAAARQNAAGPPARVFRRRLLAILFVALVARAALLLYAERRPDRFDFPDSHRYVTVARNIAAGLGPIDGEHVKAGTDPIFPYLLSIGIRAGATETPDILRFGRLVNGVIGLASVAVLAALARRRFGEDVAALAALILAVDPILLFFNALVLTESLYVLCLLLAGWAMARCAIGRSAAWLLAAGILLGIGALTRSTGFFLPLFLLPAAWAFAARGAGHSALHRLGACAALIGGWLIAVSPALCRNYALFGRVVPVRTGGGASLLEALGPWADGGPGMDRIVYPRMPQDADEVARDAICRDAALAWALDHPAAVARLALVKLARTWSPVIHAAEYRSPIFVVVSLVTVLPVYGLALAGLWLIRHRTADVLLLLAPVAYFTLIHMVFVGSVRYRVPAMPLVFVLAALGLCAALGRGAAQLRHGRSASHVGPR